MAALESCCSTWDHRCVYLLALAVQHVQWQPAVSCISIPESQFCSRLPQLASTCCPGHGLSRMHLCEHLQACALRPVLDESQGPVSTLTWLNSVTDRLSIRASLMRLESNEHWSAVPRYKLCKRNSVGGGCTSCDQFA